MAVSATNTPAKQRTFAGITFLEIALRIFQVGISYVLALLLPFPEALRFPSDSQFWHQVNKESQQKDVKIEELEEDSKTKDLFPSIVNTDIVSARSLNENNKKPNVSYAQPCSTGLTTKLLPFKNENGEIEWTFTEDGVNDFDMFKHQASGSSFQQTTNDSYEDDFGYEDEEINLSPTISNSSNNESILSSNKVKNEIKNETFNTPLTNISSPISPNQHYNKMSSVSSCSSSDEIGELSGEGSLGAPDGKLHKCPHCDATFKIRGYLTRHLKKHATKKAYSCPFHEFSVFIDENNVTHKCHPNGGFSRRDTYKTHLKSRHFKYPKGTKTKERAKSAGSCSMCGETFPNAEIWCELHVEGAECRYLPSGFKGKSRIKNRMRKQLSKQQLRELEKNGGIYSKHFSLTSGVAPSHQQPQQPQSGTDSFTPSVETPLSAHSNTTPIPMSASANNNGNNIHEYHHVSNSPAVSISSSINNMNTQQQAFPTPPNNYTASHEASGFPQPQIQAQAPTSVPTFTQDFYSHPSFDDNTGFENFQGFTSLGFEEYDEDQFCLDIDQLNNATFNNFNEIIGFMKAQKAAAAAAAASESNTFKAEPAPALYQEEEQIQHAYLQQQDVNQQQYDQSFNQRQVYPQQMQGQQCVPIQQQYQSYSNNPVMYN